MQPVIGVDVSKSKLDICLIFNENGNEKINFRVFGNNLEGFKKLVDWVNSKLKRSEKPWFCMEATGSYMEELAEFLYDSGFDVSVVNPLLIKRSKSKLHSNKTDKADAEKIARYCLSDNPRFWNPQPKEFRQLRDVCRAIDSLKVQLGQEKNKLEARLLNEAVKQVISSLISSINEQIKKLEFERQRIVDGNENIKNPLEKLMEIKGVGIATACSIISEAPSIDNFKNAKQFAAFFGVTPQHFQSGSSVKKGSHVSKIGSKLARKTLYMASASVKKHNKDFLPFVQRLENKGKKAKVIVCAIMRKLTHIFFGMLKNNSSFDIYLAFSR